MEGSENMCISTMASLLGRGIVTLVCMREL
jgi:hypothetical protein